MNLETRNFGEIEIKEENIIEFIGGVPGFSGTRYVILDAINENSPFVWLQSVDEPEIALILLNTFMLYKDYAPKINDEEIKCLEVEKREEMSVFNVIVIPEKIEDMTVNLKAPIIINTKKKKRNTINSWKQQLWNKKKVIWWLKESGR